MANIIPIHPAHVETAAPGGWRVPDDPWPMLLAIAEQREVPFATIFEVYQEMAKFVSRTAPDRGVIQ